MRGAIIRGVPFRIGQTRSGLRYAIGQGPLRGAGVTVLAEDPTDAGLLSKCDAIVRDLEALAARHPRVAATLESLKRALDPAQPPAPGAPVSGLGPLDLQEAPYGILGVPAGVPVIPESEHPYQIAGGPPGFSRRSDHLYEILGDPPRFSEEDIPYQIQGGYGGPEYKIGDIFSDIASDIGDAGSAVTHPGDAVQAIGNFLAHPGSIAEPAAFAALLTLGPAGVAYAYAADQAGVLQGLSKVVDSAGGIYLGIVKSVALGLGCTWVLDQLGLSEMGFACALFSMSVDLVKAVVNHDRAGVLDVFLRVVNLARQYGLDPLDAVKTVIQAAFQAVGPQIALLLGEVDTIRQALLDTQAMATADVNYVVDQIKQQEAALKLDIPSLPAGAKGALSEVQAVTGTPKLSGPEALAQGFKGLPATSDPRRVPASLPFAPFLRANAMTINTLALAAKAPQNAATSGLVNRALAGLLGGSSSGSITDALASAVNQAIHSIAGKSVRGANPAVRDLADRIQSQNLRVVQSLAATGKVWAGPDTDAFFRRIAQRLQPFPPGQFEQGRAPRAK